MATGRVISGGGGGQGGAIFESPTQILSDNDEIQVSNDPAKNRERIFVKDNGVEVSGITIENGSGTKELYLVGAPGTIGVELDISAPNIKTNGPVVFHEDTEVVLKWSEALGAYLMEGRNGII